MKIEVGYGNTVQTVEVPDRNLLQILRANPAPDQAGPGGEEAVRQALAHPIGSPVLE